MNKLLCINCKRQEAEYGFFCSFKCEREFNIKIKTKLKRIKKTQQNDTTT